MKISSCAIFIVSIDSYNIYNTFLLYKFLHDCRRRRNNAKFTYKYKLYSFLSFPRPGTTKADSENNNSNSL